MAKSIDDNWQIFIHLVELPPGVSEVVKAAFYAGAAACLNSMVNDKDEPWHLSAHRIKAELEARVHAREKVRH